MTHSNLSRKSFLLRALAHSLGLLGITTIGSNYYLSSLPYKEKQLANLGVQQQYDADGVFHFPQHNIWLIRQQQTFFALKSSCTHLGCPPTFKNNEFYCPCHGSRFAKDGKVLQGPAREALLRLDIQSNSKKEIIIDPRKTYTYEKGEWNEKNALLNII